MSDASERSTENFSCPHCNYPLPQSGNRFFTRGTRYRCMNCNAELSPVPVDPGVSRLLFGALLSMGTIGGLFLLAPFIGITAVVCAIILFHTIGIYSSVKFFNTHLHLVEVDTLSAESATEKKIRASLFFNKNGTPSLAEANGGELEGFMCPQCRHRLSVRKALFMTRWTRYTCPQCQKLLGPVIRELEIYGVISGLVGAGGGILLPFILKPLFGFWGVIAGYCIFLVVMIVVVGYCSHKFQHLELVNK